MLDAHDGVVGVLSRIELRDAILHLQLVDALGLIETSPAGAQFGLRRQRVEHAQAWTPLFAVVAAIIGLHIDAHAGFHRPAPPERSARIPVRRVLVTLRGWRSGADRSRTGRPWKRKAGLGRQVERIVVIAPQAPHFGAEAMFHA